MRAIILAAGIGNALDGMVKCLIRHPRTGATILDALLTAYKGLDITIVVGYRAVEIMQAYPSLHYIYNKDWAVTNNAYSLSLALDSTPTHVVSGDFFLTPPTIENMNTYAENNILVSSRENRPLTAIHCIANNNILQECYMGPLRCPEHEESLGVFKISDSDILRNWKINGLQHPNLFAAQTLPISNNTSPIKTCTLHPSHPFTEINTVDDYLRLLAEK